MDTTTTKCTNCGVEIQIETAERCDGLCAPCYRRPRDAAKLERWKKDQKDATLLFTTRLFTDAYVSRGTQAKALQNLRSYLEPLLQFLRENGLLRNSSAFEPVKDWYEFEIRVSDLTEEGLIVWNECYRGWLAGSDRGTKPTYLVRWKKALAKVRENT